MISTLFTRRILTAMQWAWQLTSPLAHLVMQASTEDWAEDKEVVVASLLEVESAALARTAKAAITMVEKRILAGDWWSISYNRE